MKETAVFDKPYVKKSALIGTEDLRVSFYNGLTSVNQLEARPKLVTDALPRQSLALYCAERPLTQTRENSAHGTPRD